MAWHAPSLPLLNKSFRIFFSVKEKSKGYRIAHLTILFSTMNPRSQFASGFQYIYIYSTPRLILILALVGGQASLDRPATPNNRKHEWLGCNEERNVSWFHGVRDLVKSQFQLSFPTEAYHGLCNGVKKVSFFADDIRTRSSVCFLRIKLFLE
jgi:hypothetical protein